MDTYNRFKALCWLLLTSLALTFQSCKQDVKEPIQLFQKSTSVATAAIGTLYNDLNDYERRLYFQGLALDPMKQLSVTDSETKLPTPFLSEPFSITAIQARLGLLRQLGTYAERLTTLAGNDAPERFQANVASLAGSLTALQGTFANLGSAVGNGDAARYVGPLSRLTGVVGSLAINQKRNAALRKAILDGEQPINELLDFLKQDLDKYVSTTRLTGAEERLSDLGGLYNSERAALTREQRQSRLDEVAALVKEYKLLQNARPSGVVRQMKIAHAALVQAVKNDNPLSVSLVLGAVDDYEASVLALLDAIHDLHELTLAKK